MRDDFTQPTLDILAKRVGVRCSNPSCHKLTTGPRTEETKIINIGVGSHITAAAPGGPRYDANLSSEERARNTTQQMMKPILMNTLPLSRQPINYEVNIRSFPRIHSNEENTETAYNKKIEATGNNAC